MPTRLFVRPALSCGHADMQSRFMPMLPPFPLRADAAIPKQRHAATDACRVRPPAICRPSKGRRAGGCRAFFPDSKRARMPLRGAEFSCGQARKKTLGAVWRGRHHSGSTAMRRRRPCVRQAAASSPTGWAFPAMRHAAPRTGAHGNGMRTHAALPVRPHLSDMAS